jgi:uncharacterized membrane protein
VKVEVKRDLLIINLIAILEVFIAILPPNDFLKIFIALPFLFFCPGYALISALFPKKEDLDTIERIVLSIGLSIAVVPLIGIVLHFTAGIKLYPILFSLAGLIFLFSLIALYRRQGVAIIYHVDIELRKTPYDLILLALLFVIGALAIQIVTTPKIEKFTEFYVLNAEEKAGDYPRNLTLGESMEVLLGIHNHEAQDVEYRVVILLENETIETIEDITLAHEEKWEEKVDFTPRKVGRNMRLEFLLYKGMEEKPYRALRLLVNVTTRELI